MTTLPSGLPLTVDRAEPMPLALQLSAQLQAAIAVGALRAGDRLPSSRDLAATLGVSRTVVTNAYTRLLAEGWLEGRHGSGTYVAAVTPPTPSHHQLERTPIPPPPPIPASASRPPTPPSPGTPLIDLKPGVPWAAGIEPAAWRRAWRQAAARLPAAQPDPHGLPELRREIAAYLRRSRGLAVTPDQVLITQGVANGLALLADELLTPGDRAGLEEPGYPTGRAVLRGAGARVVPCRVDGHGLVPGELPGGLRLLYTTPAHQYPLGGRLPVSRRQALIAWARATGAIIVEDDYDSEFRYDVGPLPALYSLDPDVIVYLGTASKVLSMAFGAGWLVAPPDLVGRLAARRPRLGARIPEPVQHALLALLRSGDLERHVRRMRLEYARRRAALIEGLTGGRGESQGSFRIRGDTAGLHLVLELPPGPPAARLVAAAAARGIVIYPLDPYYAGPPATSGVILGYGTAALPDIKIAAAILAALLATVSEDDRRPRDARSPLSQPPAPWR